MVKVYVCGNRFQLFGDRDGESGWEGHCEVCKLEWYTCRVDSSVCACGLSRLAQACCPIRVFVVLGYAVKLRWRSEGER